MAAHATHQRNVISPRPKVKERSRISTGVLVQGFMAPFYETPGLGIDCANRLHLAPIIHMRLSSRISNSSLRTVPGFMPPFCWRRHQLTGPLFERSSHLAFVGWNLAEEVVESVVVAPGASSKTIPSTPAGLSGAGSHG
ncbi:MAG TPA: hypothetical protein VGM94_02255 [Galbitalea sp.]|jgi:hypothetical protein